MEKAEQVLMAAVLLAALAGTACVDSREVPNLLPQAEVSFGDKLYLVDETREAEPTLGRCTRFGETATSTNTPRVNAVDGKEGDIDIKVPHNCFVPVVSGSLKVDVVESTNELFQLCIDSGACRGPDPSASSKSQLCSNESDFDQCPVVEVSQQEAANFCQWLGRRLPSSFEHLIVRQAAFSDADPASFRPYPTGSDAPENCDDAVTRADGCVASKPRPIGLGSTVRGAAARDVIRSEGKEIFDLLGNASEWTSDLFASRRGNAEGLPWFCIAALPQASAGEAPKCPDGDRCVYGQYKPEGLGLGIYPVCITSQSGRFSGSVGSLFGGSHRDEDVSRVRIGTFARRLESDPQGLPDTARAREYGIRCVGSRESATNGVVPPFTDELILRAAP